MNPERWQRVKELMEAAVVLEETERRPYLDRECAADPDLRREVESLLASHDQAGTGFLKSPAVRLNPEPLVPAALTGRRVGVYQIVEEIGRGGMGEIYRSVRADGQYTKQVAVKLVRGGFDAAYLLERFRTERQILATLDHPNIARLLDGGTTEDGIPYLVMELIEGMRVDAFCDQRQLTITQRLQLFRQVCAAVQYAHQRLVIHRDIKPSNILVTQDGVPKLLDFGIAKILDPAAGAEATLVRPMTPEYASPEQIRGEPITTASDVYSLGVVLYQLLTGRSPYPGDTRNTHALARAVCDTDPGRPSTVVLKIYQRGSGETPDAITPEEVSKSREGSPAKLHRRLAGDLDDIVLMALRKEPQRRYASVEQFAEDIRRHIERRPVIASKGTWAYRAGKFVRRNRVSMTATALVVFTLIAGIAATIRQARIARAERARAERRFNDVRKLSNSLIFEIHDSIQNLPGATPARKLLLDRAVEYLDKLSQDAAGDLDLQRELAWGYQRLSAVQGDTTQSNLGQISAAEESNRKAIALFEAVARAAPHNVSDQLNLAMTYRTRAFSDIYEPVGRKEIDQALAVTEPLLKTSGNQLDVLNERSLEIQILASIQDVTGEREKSAESFRKFLQLREQILRTDPNYKNIQRSVAKGNVLLGQQLSLTGARSESLQHINIGIAGLEPLTHSNDNPDVLRDLSASIMRRGHVELLEGNLTAALADFHQSRALISRIAKLDPENKMLQSDMLSLDFEEGRVQAMSGKNAQALATIENTITGFTRLKLEGDTGPGMGIMKTWVGEIQADTHNTSQAIKSFDQAVTALTEYLEANDDAHCEMAMVYNRMGAALLKFGKLTDARNAYNKALDTSPLPPALERNDYPAIYAAADAYEGLGNVAVAEAASARDPQAKSKLLSDAQASYKKSLNAWARIPNPSHLSPNGYRTGDPREVNQRLAALSAAAQTQ